MKVLARVATLTAIVAVTSAHIGSPDAWYEGDVGPYHVIMQVVTPGVVPGVATIHARVQGRGGKPATRIDQVTFEVNRFDALMASPPPEIALPVDGSPGTYSAQLWIMTAGSNSVAVTVSGDLGSGRAVIPVGVVANRRLELSPRLGGGLATVGIFLFIGLVTIIGAAVRESVLPPGEAPDGRRRRTARLAMAASTAVLTLTLFGGLRWWDSEDRIFNERIYKPLTATATIDSTGARRSLDLRISDSIWTMRNDTTWLREHGARKRSPLILDHGKLAHVFMIRNDLRAFAHLHPPTSDSVSFVSTLPPLPAGRYRVYGDIVHESGFSETVSTTVELPARVAGDWSPSDPDDASVFSRVPSNDSTSILEDGSVMTFDRGDSTFVEGKGVSLRFIVTDAEGKRLELEPYIGMAGHAVVTRDDGAVFVHLHPNGTVSMGSQMAVTMRQPGDTISGRLGQRINASTSMMPAALPTENGVVTFPYAFPKPGRYHIWVQVKHGGRILTGAFSIAVQPSAH